MLKSISAALLATSLIAAPAMAASTVKTSPAPTTKSETMTPKAGKAKVSTNKAHHRHHRVQKQSAVMKNQKVAHVAKAKQVSPAKPAAAKIKG